MRPLPKPTRTTDPPASSKRSALPHCIIASTSFCHSTPRSRRRRSSLASVPKLATSDLLSDDSSDRIALPRGPSKACHRTKRDSSAHLPNRCRSFLIAQLIIIRKSQHPINDLLRSFSQVPLFRSIYVKMTMAVEHQQRHMGGSIGFDGLHYNSPPQFTNPWASTTVTSGASQLFPASLGPSNTGFDALAKQQVARANNVSMPYSSIPVSAPSMGPGTSYSSAPYGQPELLNLSQDLLNAPRSYDQSYSNAPSTSVNSFAPLSAPYAPLSNYGPSLAQQVQHQDSARRLSQTLVTCLFRPRHNTVSVVHGLTSPTEALHLLSKHRRHTARLWTPAEAW